MAPTDRPALAAALALVARGAHVLPIWWVHDGRCLCRRRGCQSPGKHPLGDLVPRGLLDATTDPDTIRSWWKRYPHANLAIVMAPSGLIALDVDEYHGDVDRLRALVAQLGD